MALESEEPEPPREFHFLSILERFARRTARPEQRQQQEKPMSELEKVMARRRALAWDSEEQAVCCSVE